jgi:hypothetical protein
MYGRKAKKVNLSMALVSCSTKIRVGQNCVNKLNF